MKKRCIICGRSDSTIVFKEFEIDVLKCRNCGHVFSSYPADQHYDGYFGKEVTSEDQFWWDKAHEKMYTDFCHRFIVGKSGKLLDVGCGLGFFVKTISRYPRWQAFGYEVSRAAVEFATKRLRLEKIYCGRVEESHFPQKYFDIISMWDVIEHIPDPHPLLSYLSLIVKDDGILFLHTPNVQIQLPKARLKNVLKGMKPGGHYLEAKDHINIYSPRTITTVLQRSGFERVEFIHLRPIQSVAGSRNESLRFAKNVWFYASVGLHWISWGRANMDNLFAVGRK